MEQKQVKIIGLQMNQALGILKSCNITFDENNNLIPVKGEVGSGKTTLQKSLRLGTQGSDTLKYDKTLYGEIDQEIQLLDGDQKITIGCKSDSEGKLIYTLYTIDADGKKIINPDIDGVKATPALYLKDLQTKLTWRMSEIVSDNPTIQKRLLLELYRNELAEVGVIFDSHDVGYRDSILGKIEQTENDRVSKDVLRKQVGGFANHLLDRGYDVNEEGTLPKYEDLAPLEEKINKLKYNIDNAVDVARAEKENKMSSLSNEAKSIINKLRESKIERDDHNYRISKHFKELEKKFNDDKYIKDRILSDITDLSENGCVEIDDREHLISTIHDGIKLKYPIPPIPLKTIEFDGDTCVSEIDNIDYPAEINSLLNDLIVAREKYKEVSSKQVGDAQDQKQIDELTLMKDQLELKRELNKTCKAIESFYSWRECDVLVKELKAEFANKLMSISTGVPGLKINCQEKEEKFNIFLTYDGSHDPIYFSNNGDDRKVSAYSGTQKPLICLLIQNYLLNKKPKAMRYLWIDDVPIDNKTKDLLNKMGKELNLTIFVNITGDFTHEGLEAGEILIEGGEVFFNDVK